MKNKIKIKNLIIIISLYIMVACNSNDDVTASNFNVLTAEAIEVSFSNAVSGGTISGNGNATIGKRGVCWSVTSPATITHFKTEDGSGIGTFRSELNELQPLTTYYVRAYFYENGELRYGNQISFTTHENNEIIGIGIPLALGTDVKTITPTIIGFSTQCVRGPYWTETAFKDAIAAIDPGNFRYPGGTVGNFWDWETGDYLAGLPFHPTSYRNNTPNIYKLDEVKGVRTRSGDRTEPIYNLNVLTSNYEHQKASLEYAQSIGLPVTYLELGNEFYLNEGNRASEVYEEVFPSIKHYANLCRTWTADLKRDFPGCKVSIVGVFYPPNWSRERARNWNDSVRHYLSDVDYDAITIHIYTKQHDLDQTRYDMVYQTLLFSSRERVQHSSTGTKPLWVTEYNHEAATNPYPHEWIHGICALLQSAQLALLPLVEFTCFYNLAADRRSAAIYDFDYTYNSVTVSKNDLSAAGNALSILMKATKDATSMRSINFAENPAITTTRGSVMTFYGYFFSGGNSKAALLINIGEQEQTVNINGLGMTPSNVEQSRAESLSTVITPQTFLTETSEISEGGDIVLKPFSITLIK